MPIHGYFHDWQTIEPILSGHLANGLEVIVQFHLDKVPDGKCFLNVYFGIGIKLKKKEEKMSNVIAP